MTSILHLDSSAKPAGSATKDLTQAVVAKLQAAHPGSAVVYRDLAANPLPHATPDFLSALFSGEAGASHETVILSDKLIEELVAADTLVIGAPMYNFGIPSTLKAWIDLVWRAGKTFKYTPEGTVNGLAAGRKAIIVVGTGGIYAEGPMVPFDHVTPYLKQALGFIGITDVTVIRAEKQAFGAEAATQEIQNAKLAIEKDVA